MIGYPRTIDMIRGVNIYISSKIGHYGLQQSECHTYLAWLEHNTKKKERSRKATQSVAYAKARENSDSAQIVIIVNHKRL